jgi:hypothetical protein
LWSLHSRIPENLVFWGLSELICSGRLVKRKSPGIYGGLVWTYILVLKVIIIVMRVYSC